MSILTVPLTRPPTILAMSPGSWHGLHGEERYCSPFWVINLVFGGGGTLLVGGESVTYGDATALIVPSAVPVRYRFTQPATHVWTHFLPDQRGRSAPLPVATPLGPQAATVRDALAGAAARFVAEPERAQATVWAFLWSLTSAPAGGGRQPRHRLVDDLLAYLDEHIAEPVRPATLAARFGVTEQHLGRLCRRTTGLPVLAYLRRRRCDRAVQLLQTTDLPIREIAARVGVPDLQRFNKLTRAATGRPPSRLRDA